MDNGDINIDNPLSGSPVISLIGAPEGGTVIDANFQDRAFRIGTARTVNMTFLTVSNGTSYPHGDSPGGAIQTFGPLLFVDGTVQNSRAVWGGGIANMSGYLEVRKRSASRRRRRAKWATSRR